MTLAKRIESVRDVRALASVLAALVIDEDWYIRSYVGEHGNTPVFTLKTLATDEDWIVRLYVAKNPNTPKHTIIEMLLVEEDERVSEQLRERLNKEIAR